MDIYEYWNFRRRKTRALKFENNNATNSSIIFTDVPQLSNTGDVRIDVNTGELFIYRENNSWTSINSG